jgi:hypothetical protein
MHLLLKLFLVFALVFSTSASAAPSTGCCPDEDCPMVQCVTMGCAQVPQAAAVSLQTGMIASSRTNDYAPHMHVELISRNEKPWTPPD